MMKNKRGFSTKCVGKFKENRTTAPHVLPIYATSSWDMKNLQEGVEIFSGREKGHVYGRYGNPTIDAVADKIAELEGHGLDNMDPAALLFSSGMSAIVTLMLARLKTGQKILTQANLYGGTTEQFIKVLEPNGIVPVFSNLSDLEALESALSKDPTIAMIYGETPANPTLACIDIEALALLAMKYNVELAIDNTFATPYGQQPLKHGADFVIHSTTKFLNGHGNGLAGAIVAKDPEHIHGPIWKTLKLIGTNSNAWDAWLLHNGLKTLSLRMSRQSYNAMELAQYLESSCERIVKVNYPGLPSHPSHGIASKQMNGFGAMLSFEVEGGMEEAAAFVDKLKIASIAPTLGDIDTLVLHPATSSHINIDKSVRIEQGISDNLVRMSIGAEDIDDLKEDITQALK